MPTQSGNYAQYTSDGTYWTGRKRGDYIEVVRVKADSYGEVEAFGTYARTGSAVAAAAKLAYAQGWKDAQAELTKQVHAALAAVGIGPVVVEEPDIPDAEAHQVPVDED